MKCKGKGCRNDYPAPDIIDGTAYFNSVEEIIMHVMNHGTYHRGQLITMLRMVGFTAVESTDFIRYLRMKEKAS